MPSERPFVPAERPVLGINAKSLHGRTSDPDGLLNAKSRRFRLQRAAASLLFDPARDPLDQPHRVVTCNRNRKGEGVTVFRAADGSNARFSGLVTCGSVWHCPVCSAKVSEARRVELQAALVAWQGHFGPTLPPSVGEHRHGGEVFLMTLTNPHYADMPLADHLERQAKARQRFKNSRTFKRIMAQYGRIGSVASLEATYGAANGWHPHVHELIFARHGLADDVRAVDELKAEWCRILDKVGLSNPEKHADMLAHALDIRGGNFAAEYVAKFGIDPRWSEAHELTKAHAKIGGRTISAALGHAAHVTPFQLLEWYLKGDRSCGPIFIEYAKAFEGKRMLSYSPGLKKALGLAERDDAELADADDALPAESVCIVLSADEWRLVLERDARGELLFIAAKNGYEGVRCLLFELEHHRRRTHRGDSEPYMQRPRGVPAGWNFVKPVEGVDA